MNRERAASYGNEVEQLYNDFQLAMKAIVGFLEDDGYLATDLAGRKKTCQPCEKYEIWDRLRKQYKLDCGR